MCSGSETGSQLRLIYFLYHSTLGLIVIKKKRRLSKGGSGGRGGGGGRPRRLRAGPPGPREGFSTHVALPAQAFEHRQNTPRNRTMSLPTARISVSKNLARQWRGTVPFEHRHNLWRSSLSRPQASLFKKRIGSAAGENCATTTQSVILNSPAPHGVTPNRTHLCFQKPGLAVAGHCADPDSDVEQHHSV